MPLGEATDRVVAVVVGWEVRLHEQQRASLRPRETEDVLDEETGEVAEERSSGDGFVVWGSLNLGIDL